MSKGKFTLILLAVIVLAVVPLIINPNAEYGGADGEAEGVILEIQPDYEPWFSSIYEPPSGEIESLLFCLQAGLGGMFIGYYVGFVKGRHKGRSEKKTKTA